MLFMRGHGNDYIFEDFGVVGMLIDDYLPSSPFNYHLRDRSNMCYKLNRNYGSDAENPGIRSGCDIYRNENKFSSTGNINDKFRPFWFFRNYAWQDTIRGITKLQGCDEEDDISDELRIELFY